MQPSSPPGEKGSCVSPGTQRDRDEEISAGSDRPADPELSYLPETQRHTIWLLILSYNQPLW